MIAFRVLRWLLATLGMAIDIRRDMRAQNRAMAAAAAFAPETCPTPRGRDGRGEAVSAPPPGEPASPPPNTLVDSWGWTPQPGEVEIPEPTLRTPATAMKDAADFLAGLSFAGEKNEQVAHTLIADLRIWAALFHGAGGQP